MRTFCDLSLPVEGTIQSAKIAEMVRTAYRLGYSVVAVNNIVSGPLKPKVHVSERAWKYALVYGPLSMQQHMRRL